MSIIYERLKTNVTNEVYHNVGIVQFQFLGKGNCISVWDGVIWLMLKGDVVHSNGWIRNRDWITIYKDGEVSCR